jgi:S-adenosylmethionine:tRNA ribosyltransferase-isomerase
MAGKAMPDQHEIDTSSSTASRAYERDDFHYELPDVLIAQHPAANRDGSRLLVLDGDERQDLRFSDLPSLLGPEDLLVVNDTRVLKARLKAQKDSGGQAEVLLERILDDETALCQVRVSKPLREGRTLLVGGHRLESLGREGQFYRLRFDAPVLEVLEAHGSVPLPPYIERDLVQGPDAEDEARYQTVWSAAPGAVAAPTAGLHFSEALLAELEVRGVRRVALTLHVGAGTFQPVRVNDLSEHQMHTERYRISEGCIEAIETTRAAGGRIVAVGTTVVRALESAAAADGALRPGSDESSLFITPGYSFKVVDALITNFHLPESTLLMLVTAFGGYDRVMAAYHHAVAAGYRFFSYGDAMFLSREEQARSRRECK